MSWWRRTGHLTVSVFACIEAGACNWVTGIDVPTDRPDGATNHATVPADADAPSQDATPIVDGEAPADAGTNLCPSDMPPVNGSCPSVELICQFKDDPRGDVCRDTATCSESGWLTTRH